VIELTREEYRELRAAMSDRARIKGTSGLYHLCRKCGRCEYAGGFCSWCTTSEYDLVAHLHPQRAQCPLAGGSTGQAEGFYRHQRSSK